MTEGEHACLPAEQAVGAGKQGRDEHLDRGIDQALGNEQWQRQQPGDAGKNEDVA